MLFWLKNNWFIVIIIVAVALFLVVDRDEQQEEESDISIDVVEKTEAAEVPLEEREDLDKQTNTLFVDVKGEVTNPGVYQIEQGARVDDIIILAGGLTDLADPQSVNLAQKAFDEMVINVSKKGESAIITKGIATSSGNEAIRINYATKEEIASLNGIGETKASAIVQYREEHGYFKKVEDLLQVKGIGEKTLESIKEFIQVP